MEPADLRRMINRLQGQRQEVLNNLRDCERRLEESKRNLSRAEKARAIIQLVAQETQKQLEFHINDLVTMALSIVFDDPYELAVRFEERRGKTEADLLFLRGGELIDPMGESGGGAVDVAAFALRVAMWVLQKPRTRNTFILDEPFRFVSRDIQPKASEMLRRISEQLGIQIIMVSHSEDLIECAHRVFRVGQKSGVSRVEVGEGNSGGGRREGEEIRPQQRRNKNPDDSRPTPGRTKRPLGS